MYKVSQFTWEFSDDLDIVFENDFLIWYGDAF